MPEDPDEPPLPSPEHVADLVRRGEAIRREAERLVEDAFRAFAGDPALGAAAADDVAALLGRRASAAGRGRQEPGRLRRPDEQDETGCTE